MLPNLKNIWMLKEQLKWRFWKLPYASLSEGKVSSRNYGIFTVVCPGQFPVRWGDRTLVRQAHTIRLQHWGSGHVLPLQSGTLLLIYKINGLQFYFFFIDVFIRFFFTPLPTFQLTEPCTCLHLHILVHRYLSWFYFVLFSAYLL